LKKYQKKLFVFDFLPLFSTRVLKRRGEGKNLVRTKKKTQREKIILSFVYNSPNK
jgi:hypothetical protein